MASSDLLRGLAPIGFLPALWELFSMALEIQTGTPPAPGRYVVWTPCKALSARQWCEPSIATWHDGRWHSYEPVWGWIGPLPLCNATPPISKEEFQREYDL